MSQSAAITIRERPMLFRRPMVRAILDGWKTQTRRVCRAQSGPELGFQACPYGQSGDRLWVRETWCCKMEDGEFVYDKDGNHVCHYAADGYEVLKDDGDGGHVETKSGRMASPWRPSIFMPRHASRITLEILSVRVEWLQDISGADAIAEGIPLAEHKCGCEACSRTSQLCPASASSAILAYVNLWDSNNGKRKGCAWADNPWVWVIEFRRVER